MTGQASEACVVPTETAKTYRGYSDFTDPMLRAAAAGEVKPDSDSMRWMGYADQELTRLRALVSLPSQPGYASGRPQYALLAPFTEQSGEQSGDTE